MKQLWRWVEGRQGTGYQTFTLIHNHLLKLDCLLIRYKPGASIPEHTDPVGVGYKHHRLNIELKAARQGGELVCHESLLRIGPIHYFRPDKAMHAVTEVKEGTRYVFSIGWLKRRK